MLDRQGLDVVVDVLGRTVRNHLPSITRNLMLTFYSALH